MALINKQKAIDEIRDFQAQVTCGFSNDWESGINEGFDHAIAVIELMETVDAIPVEWIKQFIKKENIHISNKVGIAYMVEQWKLHPIDFEISSEQQWIPVSKKLPNKNDYVIVTTKSGVVIEAQFEVWNSGVKEWWIDNDNSFEFDDVVAWMELPKPYERKEE